MPTAFNKKTGELRVLDQSGKWVEPTLAENPQTRERLYHDGEEWRPVPLSENEEGAGFAASVLQGPTLSLGDELVAGLETLGGGNYGKSLEKFRGIEARYRQANPVTAFAATAGGGLIGGGLHLGRGAMSLVERLLPNAGRIGQAAAVGAGFGAAAGFGSGEGGFEDRAKSAVVGAGLGAGFGAGVEALNPVLSRFVQAIRGRPRLVDPTGSLTPEGQQAARNAGLDPGQASQALQREFGLAAEQALRPAQAVPVAEAQSLPVPVNLRRGQVTLDPDQQMFETQAAKGVYGQLAGETIRGSDEAQQAALRGNIPAIATRVGGGQVQELGQGVAQAQRVLATAEQASRARVRQLYESARATNGDAFILGRNVGESLVGIRQGLEAEGFTAAAAGRVHNIINGAAEDLARVADDVGREPNISVGNLFGVRQQLSALSRSSDQVEATAAGHAKRALDNWLNTALDEDLIQGDRAVVELWRRAILGRREHARHFQAGDFVEKLTARARDGSGELKLDPQAAVNLIFGRSETGFTSQSGMVRGLTRLRNQLGENSQAWRALKEEAFLRFARSGEGATTPTGRDFSGANFAKAWESALAKSPGTMRLLFTNEERNLISQFARVARRVTTNVRGGANSSNTSAGVAQIVRRLWLSSVMGPRMAAFLEGVPFIRGLSNITHEMRAQNAILRNLERGTPAPPPLADVSAGAPVIAGAGVSSQR